MSIVPFRNSHASADVFFGLAPFLRMSIAGLDIQPIAQEMLTKIESDQDNALLWINLSTAMMCLGQSDLGLRFQSQALELQRTYTFAALRQPARLRLLTLMVAGDLSANTPIDCLLETGDVDVIQHYVSAENPLAEPVPEHDVVLVAPSEGEENRALFAALEPALADWPRPVINAPQHIPSTGRAAASALLHDAPGVLIPPTLRAPRSLLQAIAAGTASLRETFDDTDFPLILRPVGSHAGRNLERIAGSDELATYLARVGEMDFFLSRFIDYRSPDGWFRKMRVALINGEAFACHMGVSSHWMIHYVNAGMYDEAWKRDEEASFMANFSDFAQRHRLALQAIHQRTKLDYLCIDCAEMPDGRLLVFEIDHAMVIHAMDPEDLFPYKQAYMAKVKNAFEDFLFRLAQVKR